MNLLFSSSKVAAICRLGLGCLLLIQLGCFSHIETYQRQPVNTTNVLSINSCRITKVTIPTIPNATIRVNEADTTIYVRYPETVQAQSFKVAYTLNSPNCSIWNTDLNAEHSTCGETWNRVNVIFTDHAVNYSSRNYKVKYEPVGQFTIGQGTEPLLLTVGESKMIEIQAVNYFRRPGYPAGVKATLVRLSDGKTLLPSLMCSPSTDNTTIASQRLRINFAPSSDEIGTYELKLQLPDGSTITSSQPVVIRLTDKLLVTNAGYFYDYLPVPGQTYYIGGYNLTEANKVGIDLIGADGVRMKLPVLEYRHSGLQLVVRIPENTKNGHYVLQATRNGGPTDQVSHFVVSDRSLPTFNQAFSTYTQYPPLTASMQLGQLVYLRFQPVIGPAGYIKTRLKLVSKANPALVYLTDVRVVEEKPYAGFYPPSVQLPTDWLPGEYTASLVQIQPNGSVLEGPPHPQAVRLTL